VNGLTTAMLGKPDFNLACLQHQKYIEALQTCDVSVTIIDEDNRFPDSVFIEDTALLTPNCAIVMNPGAESRRGETEGVIPVLRKLYDSIEFIEPPGNVEGGDIMMVGSHYYIGLSSRTNSEGAGQTIHVLERYGLSGSMIPLQEMLHLKTGLAYLENNNLLATGEFLGNKEFEHYNILEIKQKESYAANSIWINGRVIMPAGYPDTQLKVQKAGYEVVEVDTSEFRKLDGGVSCLSLRF
jgi:dimethylargininase